VNDFVSPLQKTCSNLFKTYLKCWFNR